MRNQTLKKFDHQKISVIMDEIELPEYLLSEAKQKNHDIQIVNFLIKNDLFDHAIKFLAFGLPVREAIWWSYICADELERDEQCLNTQNALRCINDWVKSPAEERRLCAKVFAEALGLYTPSSWSAMAVFWSGGTIAPQGKPEVEPEEYMSGYAVSNSLILAAERDKFPGEKKKLYIKRGLHIAMGGNGRIT